MVRYSSIRFLLALAAKHDLKIDQMDVVTAFLQGDLNEEVYMVQPKEFRKGTQACLLKKSLYGLKQASRQWNIKVDAAIKSIGLTQSKVDPCVYYSRQDGRMLFQAIYVDDLLIFSNNETLIEEIKTALKSNFKMKDLG